MISFYRFIIEQQKELGEIYEKWDQRILGVFNQVRWRWQISLYQMSWMKCVWNAFCSIINHIIHQWKLFERLLWKWKYRSEWIKLNVKIALFVDGFFFVHEYIPNNKFIQLLLTSIARLSNEVDNSKAIGILIFKYLCRKKSLNLLFAIKIFA